MCEAAVRCIERLCRVLALEDASAIGGQQQTAGVARIKVDIVHDYAGRSHQTKGLAAIHGFP